jgi:hypothetical protein
MLAHLTLRRLLAVDAASCFAMGLALTVAAQPVASLTAIGSTFLFGSGLILLAVAAFIIVVAMPQESSRPAVVVIAAGNVGWVAASLAVLALGIVSPNAFGAALVITQAAAVAVLALLEWIALGHRNENAPMITGI